MTKVPFSLPLIDDAVQAEVNDCLTNTGWLTTGPKVRQLEEEVKKLCGAKAALCVNSWTSGAMLMLRWFDIGPGDEVIIPAYTYSATALCVMNIGAKPVMVDVGDDFNIALKNIRAAITSKTKAILPVDVGGYPCDYDRIMELVNEVFEPSGETGSETSGTKVKRHRKPLFLLRENFSSNGTAVSEKIAPKVQFKAKSERQKKLGRPLVLADAAHSIGALYKGRPAGTLADVTVFSLHSVKNITTGEGGCICLNLPHPFDNQAEYQFLKAFALNGQTKSAFEKNQPGAWRYDIIAQGLKVNMPDICAAIGLAQIRKYESELLPERKRIFTQYNEAFSQYDWAILPPFEQGDTVSSCHLYMLRITGIGEEERDEIIRLISEKGVGVNVHYIPMAMLTLFINKGYDIADYPNTYRLYANEISLPIYNGLTEEQVAYVIEAVVDGVEKVMARSFVMEQVPSE